MTDSAEGGGPMTQKEKRNLMDSWEKQATEEDKDAINTAVKEGAEEFIKRTRKIKPLSGAAAPASEGSGELPDWLTDGEDTVVAPETPAVDPDGTEKVDRKKALRVWEQLNTNNAGTSSSPSRPELNRSQPTANNAQVDNDPDALKPPGVRR